jgi:soluble lytic murein transglycosylase-like protein
MHTRTGLSIVAAAILASSAGTAHGYVAQDPGASQALSLSQQIEAEGQALKDTAAAVPAPVSVPQKAPATRPPVEAARPALALPNGADFSDGKGFDGSGAKPAVSLGAAGSSGGSAAPAKGQKKDEAAAAAPQQKEASSLPQPAKGLVIPEIPSPIDVTPKGWFQIPPDIQAAPGTADEETVVRIAKEKGMNAGIVLAAYREARRQGVDYRMILAIIKQESSFNPTLCSGAGACGLMQLMPATGRSVGVAPNERFDPVKNIRGGVTYLKGLFEKFSNYSWAQLNSLSPAMLEQVKAAIAAYNAGPGAVKKYGGKVPPYQETRDYVVKVLRNYVEYRSVFPQ